jgi:hypothetical protein
VPGAVGQLLAIASVESISKSCSEVVKNHLGKYLDFKLAERLLDTASGMGDSLVGKRYCEEVTSKAQESTSADKQSPATGMVVGLCLHYNCGY